ESRLQKIYQPRRPTDIRRHVRFCEPLPCRHISRATIGPTIVRPATTEAPESIPGSRDALSGAGSVRGVHDVADSWLICRHSSAKPSTLDDDLDCVALRTTLSATPL